MLQKSRLIHKTYGLTEQIALKEVSDGVVGHVDGTIGEGLDDELGIPRDLGMRSDGGDILWFRDRTVWRWPTPSTSRERPRGRSW